MKYCCPQLKLHLQLTCNLHSNKYECPDVLLDQHKNGSVGIIVHDGGSSMITIKYCPWCGKKIMKLKTTHKQLGSNL